ncbi:MAG: protease complex subunit PrcB family protein [Firmicutes bacterium]|nr:protease complex subunit PrcB family protein [Bacillota bacterium]
MKFQRLDVQAGEFPRVFAAPAFHIIQSHAEMLAIYGDEYLAEGIDFRRMFVVGVHRGLCRSGGFSVGIGKIERKGNQVVVNLAIRDPAPGDLVTLVMTYPSDVVAVWREGLHPGERVEFVFRDQAGNEVHRCAITAVQPGG